MADDANTNGPPSDPVQFFFSQLRGVTEQLAGLGRIAETMPVPSALRTIPTAIPSEARVPPLPGALTAAQLNAIAATVRSQRSSVQSLQAQLTAFDEQLEVLERIIAPLAQWSSTWADLERSVMTGATPVAAASAEESATGSEGTSAHDASSGSRTTSGATRSTPSRPRGGTQEEKNNREKPPLR